MHFCLFLACFLHALEHVENEFISFHNVRDKNNNYLLLLFLNSALSFFKLSFLHFN